MAYLKHAVRIVYTFHLQLELVITKKNNAVRIVIYQLRNHHFFMLFPWFSYGFPKFSHAFPIVFLWFSYGSPMVFHSYPMVFP